MNALSANLVPPMAVLVKHAQAGDAAARSELFSSLYSELHRMARREAGRYGPNVANVLIGPTTLLHEAYMEISQRDALSFPNQGHFMAYAARAMRGLVIDRVRARNAQKRGGGLDITALDTEVADQIEQPELLTDVSEALDELALLDPDLAHVVDLKFFCGFTMPEIAALQGVSERTVQRQWEKARLILFHALSPD